MARTITAEYIDATPADAAEVASLFDEHNISFENIGVVNWKEYPYSPEANFRIAHNGSSIMINYCVREEAVRAEAKCDNGRVWEDSCVEFFITFDNKTYYNVECNCCGTILLANGEERDNRRQASTDTLNQILRHSSLNGKLPEGNGRPVSWEVSLIIPVTVFFNDTIENLEGIEARCNFYKCGDLLPTPHFLSWNPITTETPDFHRPDHFGSILFNRGENKNK